MTKPAASPLVQRSVPVPPELFASSGLGSTDRLFYLRLVATLGFAEQEFDLAWATRVYPDMSRTTIYSALRRLSAAGWLSSFTDRIDPGGKPTRFYRLRFEPGNDNERGKA